MAVDDFFEREAALAAGVTAVALSPRVRGAVRTGAVYGLAGVLKVGDVATGAARGMANGVRGARDGDNPAGASTSATTPATTADPVTPTAETTP